MDWGLGHASRSIPVIKSFIARGHEVIIASHGDSLYLLKNEFPDLSWEELPGYNPIYSSNNSLIWSMLRQLPKFRKVMKEEHQLLSALIQKHRLSAVISDNRYGLYSKNIPSVLITHQLKLSLPKSPLFPATIADQTMKKLLRNFSQIWVPDNEDEPNISGALSHHTDLDPTFIGVLSRLEYKLVPQVFDLMVLLSGPEPQRSLLENLILDQLPEFNGKVLFVRGKPEIDIPIRENNNVIVKSFLNSAELNLAINQSAVVLCRSGYSSIMDMLKMRKRAILIPTPGQTEQEYLAKSLQNKGWFYACDQSEFDLETSLSERVNYTLPQHMMDQNFMMGKVVKDFCTKYID